MARKKARVHQQEIAFRSWGGARRGAGRRPSGDRALVSHRTRPTLCARHPIHVTVRLRAGLPSLRSDPVRRVIERAFTRGAEGFGFRLVQHSIQSNHLHLIAEAEDKNALSRGMQGLLVRVARALNKLWMRKGSVLADRYHARTLRTPREVRYALVYVLHNARHHGLKVAEVDRYSSGAGFDGWTRKLKATVGSCALACARNWLLRVGWRRHGLIGWNETPSQRHP